MPLPLTISCSSKIQIGFTFLVPAHPGSPGQRAVKRVCVCVYCINMLYLHCSVAIWCSVVFVFAGFTSYVEDMRLSAGMHRFIGSWFLALKSWHSGSNVWLLVSAFRGQLLVVSEERSSEWFPLLPLVLTSDLWSDCDLQCLLPSVLWHC